MTDEEYERERREIAQLEQDYEALKVQYNRAVKENAMLEQEHSFGEKDVESAISNVGKLHKAVVPQFKRLEPPLLKEVGVVSDIKSLLKEIKESYLLYKVSGEASKELTRLNEKYNTSFKKYNQLRQVSIAYVIGLDTHIWTSDTARKVVEEIYLANTPYWLSYAITSVMLWASNEKDAAERAIAKAAQMDESRASLFYLFVNLRFARTEAAREWCKIYLNGINANAVRDDMKYIFEALLGGSFGDDKEFQNLCIDNLRKMFIRLHRENPSIDGQIHNKIMQYFETVVSVSSKEFTHLGRNALGFNNMKNALGGAEKNQILLDYFTDIYSSEVDSNQRLQDKIEESLYALVSAYDQEEKLTIDKMQLNEMIVKANGDRKVAEEAFDKSQKLSKTDKNLAMFMTDLALSGDKTTPAIVKKFAMKYISRYCADAVREYAGEYINERKDEYEIQIDGWSCTTDENGFEANKPSLVAHYKKLIKKQTRNDKTTKISFVAAMLAAMIGAIFLGLAAIPGMLAVGLVIGLLGVATMGSAIYIICAQWKKIYLLNEKNIAYGVKNLADTLSELEYWKATFDKEHAVNEQLASFFSQEM